jgi:List-Bact-rpt repeat protein
MIPSSSLAAMSAMALIVLAWPLAGIAAQLSLTWSDASTNELGFSVERSTGTTGAFSEVARTGSGGTTYTDTTVAASTSYCYRVRAFNAVGYSAYSNVACATPVASVSLAVVKIDAGDGTVASAPTGINCGASCSATYASGTAVTLTATAAVGSTFSGWTGGGCGGTGACTVTVTAATTVTADFALKSSSALSVAPQGLTFSKVAGQANPPAQTVTVTAPAGQVWKTYDTMPFANVTGLPGVPSGVTGTGTGSFQVVSSSGMSSLAAGVYNGSITVSASGFADIVIPVQVVVTTTTPAPAPPLPPPAPTPGSLSASPQSLTFSKVVGQSNPPAQTVTVTAAAGQVWKTYDTMPFANVTGLPGVPSGVTGTGTVSFQVVSSSGMSSLAAGVYNGSITVSTAGAADLTIPVQVIVTGP